MNKTLTFVLPLGLVLPLGACDVLGDVGGGDGASLPPIESLFIPKPSDAASSTAVQAACADGNETITALEARIDELNASVADDLALLQGLYEASPTGTAGISSFDVDADGRTLHVELVEAAGQVAITGTIDGEDYLDGAYDTDGTAGALTLKTADGEIASTWETEGDKTAIARVEGELHVAVSIESTKVALAIESPDGAEAAEWDRETRAGRYASADAVGCWDGAEAAADMCDAACAD